MSASKTRTTPADRSRLMTPAFVALAVASVAYFTAAGMTLPALPQLVTGRLGGGDVAVGIVFGAFSVSAVLLRPAAGLFGDRRGRRPLLLVGALLAGSSILAYGLAPNAAVLVVLRLVGGVGEALFFVGMVTMFTDLAPPDRRGEAMSLASLGLYLGIAIGPTFAEWLATAFGLTAVWIGASMACGAAALVVTRVPETLPAPEVSPITATQARARQRLIHPVGLPPGVLLLCSIVGMAAFLAFVPLHVTDIGMTGSGPVLGLFAGVIVLVRSAGARLPDRLGPVRCIRVALSFSVVSLVMIAAWHDPLGVLIGAVLLGLGVALLTPSVFALAAARAPAGERGQVMATTSAFIDIAFGLGPMSMGFVAALSGRPSVFAAGALFALGGLVFLGISQGHGARPMEPAGTSSTPGTPGT